MNSDKIKLVLPHAKYRAQVQDMVQKIRDAGSRLHGTSFLNRDFDAWLADYKINKHERVEYLVFRQSDKKLIGLLQIRNTPYSPLSNYMAGHVGYSVCIDERGKGYATRMLKMGLELCKTLGIDPVIIKCKAENLASIKVVLKNNGKLNHEETHDGESIKFFHIKV